MLLGAPLFVAGCGAPEYIWAPDDAVARATYAHDGPKGITLLTMISNDTGRGHHSALLINGSQRVIFDPAGTVNQNLVPERHDVLFGATPQFTDFYIRAHSRETFHVLLQEIPVSPGAAERALQIVLAGEPAAPGYCTQATSAILQQLPGLGFIKSTWYPHKLAEQVATIPGVRESRVYEDDADDKSIAIESYRASLSQAR